MGWTDEQVEELKRLWEQGLTTGEIGKALGVSKNAVVGKAHRLELTSRPSPIRRAEDENNDAAPVQPKKKAVAEKPAAEKENAAVAKKKPAAVEKKKVVTVNDLTATSCRWPIGDPKDPDFHFCGAHALPDRPYCEEHAAMAYVMAKSIR